jgi:hypothetical protein
MALKVAAYCSMAICARSRTTSSACSCSASDKESMSGPSDKLRTPWAMQVFIAASATESRASGCAAETVGSAALRLSVYAGRSWPRRPAP